jgi:sigma-B regulation protein RsbU (phosphoserine phosphatase)
VLSKGAGSVRLSNAGHEPPLLRAPDGAFSSFRADAPPLGILSEVEYPEVELELSGGTLYLCSDGITEALVPEGGELGVEGLKKLIDRFAFVPLGERIDAIVGEVCKLALRDDVTILGVCDEADPEDI